MNAEAPPAFDPPVLTLAPATTAPNWSSRAALDLRRIEQRQSLGMSIVELPPEGVPGSRSRPRHALSVRSEMPQRMLRSMGVEASDCATRFRMPTKLSRDAEGGSSLVVRAHLGLACRF